MQKNLIQTSYVTERSSDGFSFYNGGPDATHIFASECIKLGYRLASERKDIVDICTSETPRPDRMQHEIAVRVKIKHRIKPVTP